MHKLLIVTLLLSSAQLSARTPLANLKNSLVNKELIGKLKRVGAAALVGVTLAVTTPLVAIGGEEDFNKVTAADPTYRHGVVLLRSDNLETGMATAFHFVHVGSDAQGNAVLLGRELALNSIVAQFLGEGYNISLYGWDGMITDDLTVNVTEVFEDSTDGTFNVIALTVEGLDLTASYPSVTLGGAFPYDSAVDLELLTYRLGYLALLSEEEIAADEFTLRWQACNLEPHAAAAKIGVGFTTCGNPSGHVALGSLIFHDGRAVALQSRPTGRRDKRTWLAAGIPQLAVDFANAINGHATQVAAKAKLATTWGALKRGALRDTHH